MNKPKHAESHTSKVLSELLNEITPAEQTRTENRMLLAARIDEARRAKGWNQQQFAAEMKKQPSVISKWLSGTHSFTDETLWDISEKLGVDLILVKEKEWKVTRVVEYKIEVQGTGAFTRDYVTPYTVSPWEELTVDVKPHKYG